MFAFAVISIEVWDTEFPVWGLILALIICTLSWLLNDVSLIS